MECLWLMLGVGRGTRIHDCTDQQAGYVQVALFLTRMANDLKLKSYIALCFRAANQILRFALEGRLSLALEPPDYNQVFPKDNTL